MKPISFIVEDRGYPALNASLAVSLIRPEVPGDCFSWIKVIIFFVFLSKVQS